MLYQAERCVRSKSCAADKIATECVYVGSSIDHIAGLQLVSLRFSQSDLERFRVILTKTSFKDFTPGME